jgi:mRNA interferase YafQ
LIIIYTGQFKRDYKLASRQDRNLEILKDIITHLISGRKLDAKYRDHKLSGRLKNYRELHIQPDWLLIYRITKDELHLVRIGSHSELFK